MNFLDKLRKRRVQIGTLITLPSAEVCEVLSTAGFDWLWIDMEHGHIGIETLLHILQAVREPCHAVIRVPAADPVWIKRVLDTGCEGLIVPQVNSAAEARDVVSWSKYPPKGRRSVGMSRAHGYGMNFKEYVDRINDDLAVIVQIEHITAVKNVEAIVDVDGVGGILVGPYDLSASMGKIGRVGDEDVVKNIGLIRKACAEAGKPLGIFAADAETADRYIGDGFSFVAIGTDTMFLASGAKDILDRLRKR